jgi:hypothetical protein
MGIVDDIEINNKTITVGNYFKLIYHSQSKHYL